MADLVNPPAVGRRFGETQRHDAWWVEIIPVVVLLGGFGLYATLRAFEGRFYDWGPYLSPFYSPLIDPHHHWWPFSPALLILGGPLGFRVTCYYYRKAYYRAFFLDPLACADNIIQRDREAMRLRQENVPEMPGELRSLLADEKGGAARRA